MHTSTCIAIYLALPVLSSCGIAFRSSPLSLALEQARLCNWRPRRLQRVVLRLRLQWGCRRRARRLLGRLPGVRRAGLLLWVLGRRLRMCSLDVCKDPVQSMEQQSHMRDEACIAGGCRGTSDLGSKLQC